LDAAAGVKEGSGSGWEARHANEFQKFRKETATTLE
jgi:hypothetical protein